MEFNLKTSVIQQAKGYMKYKIDARCKKTITDHQFTNSPHEMMSNQGTREALALIAPPRASLTSHPCTHPVRAGRASPKLSTRGGYTVSSQSSYNQKHTHDTAICSAIRHPRNWDVALGVQMGLGPFLCDTSALISPQRRTDTPYLTGTQLAWLQNVGSQ